MNEKMQIQLDCAIGHMLRSVLFSMRVDHTGVGFHPPSFRWASDGFRDAVRLCVEDYWEECVARGATELDEDPRLACLAELREKLVKRHMNVRPPSEAETAYAMAIDMIDAMTDKPKEETLGVSS